jgi:hypothetical protein
MKEHFIKNCTGIVLTIPMREMERERETEREREYKNDRL